MADSKHRSIRFGILCNEFSLTAWEHRTVLSLLARPNTSLELSIQLAVPAVEPVTAPDSTSSTLWRSYLKWFHNPLALRQAVPDTLIQQVPRCAYPAHAQLNASQTLEDAALTIVQEHHLDFILSFASSPIPSRLLAVPPFGIWVFHLGKRGSEPLSPVGFWEIYNHELTTTATLHQLTANGVNKVLRHGTFRTQRYSSSQAADSIYTECANWPADVCRSLLAGHDLPSSSATPSPSLTEKWQLTNPAMLAFLVRLVKEKIQHLYHTFLRADQWNIGVVNRPVQDFLRPSALQGAEVEAPPLPNRNIFYADGFARQEEGKAVIYFELYDYRVRRGNISRLPYPWLPGSVPTKVISFPFHLSYPFLFGPYCIPEAWSTNSIRLYDLRAPITNPEAGQVLVNAPGIDSTLLEYQGRYWLFYTRADRDPMLNLFISYADALNGPWHEHAQNPVKTDIRTARPAGPFFEEAGRLYRPAQDCAFDYGHGIIINEVLTLTPTEYTEREIMRLSSPHPDYPDGMHTIAALDATHTLIDFKRYRFIPLATLIALWGPISGLIYGEGGRKGRRKLPADT